MVEGLVEFSAVTRRVVVLALFLVCTPLYARSYYWNYVHRGGVLANTPVGTPAKFQGSYPGASVRVDQCNTSTLATIYSDVAGTAKSNPFNASSVGFYAFWTDLSCVKLTFSGGGLADAVTIDDVQITAGAASATLSSFATAGDGSTGSPWTGWDLITFAAITYNAPCGTYAFATWPNLNALHGLRIVGEGDCTIFKHTGTGDGVTFTFVGGNGLRGIELSNIFIKGNANTTNCLRLKRVVASTLYNVRAADCTGSGMLFEGSNSMLVVLPRVSSNEPGGFATQPAEGLTFNIDGATPAHAITVVSPAIGGVSGAGIHIKKAHDIRIVGGTSSGNAIGLEIDAFDGVFPVNNHINMDLEANTKDALIKGPKNKLDFVGSTSTVHLSGGTANDNVITGGSITNLLIDGGATRNFINGVNIGSTLTDSGSSTAHLRTYLEATSNYYPQTVHGHLRAHGPTAAVSGATGLDTGSAAVEANSTDYAGAVVLSPTGTPLSQGSFTVTFSVACTVTGQVPAVFASLSQGSGTWDARATTTITSQSGSAFAVKWDNNAVALTAGQTYRVHYMAVCK